jgi:hypothetical protein
MKFLFVIALNSLFKLSALGLWLGKYQPKHHETGLLAIITPGFICWLPQGAAILLLLRYGKFSETASIWPPTKHTKAYQSCS